MATKPKVYWGKYAYMNKKTKKDKTLKEQCDTLKKEVSKIKKDIKIDSEIRFKDTFLATTVSTAGFFTILNAMIIGDVNGTRDGTFTTTKTLHIKGNFLCSDATQIFRMIVVIDKQSNGLVAVEATFLDLSIVTPPVFAFRHFDYLERFTVISDEMFGQVVNADTDMILFDRFFKLNVRTNHGLGNTGAIGDISHNAIYVFLVSDSGAVAHPTVNLAARITYEP